MLYFPLWKRILIWGLCAFGLFFAFPNLFYSVVEKSNDAKIALLSETRSDDIKQLEKQKRAWPSFLPDMLVNLGLDLRGGAHLLGEVQLEKVHKIQLVNYWPNIRKALRKERDKIGTIRRDLSQDDILAIRISKPEMIKTALKIVQKTATPINSLTDINAKNIVVTESGNRIFVRLSDAEKKNINERTIRQSLEIIRNRVDEAGTREPNIQRQGANRILIQVPGIGSALELKKLIGQTAKLSLHHVVNQITSPDEIVSIDEIIIPSKDLENNFYVLENIPVIEGEDLIDAQSGFDPRSGLPIVSFRLNVAGGRDFGIYTSENVGALFAIVLDGKVISSATINEPITGGSAMISGRFTQQETIDLALLLRAGALPAEIVFLEERTVGPELGQDSIDAGRTASLVAFIAILVVIWASYGLFGFFANIALILNIALIFAVLSIIGATLTLPGIAGIVLTIGMAVDANVLIFERIREELANARGPAEAIVRGYERAQSAIFDANITTFITAVILFALGSGPVRGFAVTLAIGIITSVFTAFFVTRILIATWFEHRRPRKIKV